MKKVLPLLVMPALLLTSCASKGKEISKEEANQIMRDISENSALADAVPDNIEIQFTLSTVIGEEKIKSNMEFVLKCNEDNEVYFKVKGNSEDTKYDFEFYIFNTEKYGSVNYLKAYDYEEKKYEVICYANNSLEDYNRAESYKYTAILPLTLFGSYSTPLSFADEFDEDVEYKFYSNGAKNLTIEVSRLNIDTDDSEELVKDAKLEVTYDNYQITSLYMYSLSNLGNVSKAKGTINYSNKKIEIKAPSGWEKQLETL